MYILALAQRRVRLIEVSADLPAAPIMVEGLPEDAGRAVRGVGEVTHWPSGRVQGREGQKLLLRQFARRVDQALRPVLGGSGLPLVLAAAEPLASLYRSVNTSTRSSPTSSSKEARRLERGRARGARAAEILDDLPSGIAAWRTLFRERESWPRDDGHRPGRARGDLWRGGDDPRGYRPGDSRSH